MIIAQRLGVMEKRRVGTRFIDREATEEDQAKPLMEILANKGINCAIMQRTCNSNKVPLTKSNFLTFANQYGFYCSFQSRTHTKFCV